MITGIQETTNLHASPLQVRILFVVCFGFHIVFVTEDSNIHRKQPPTVFRGSARCNVRLKNIYYYGERSGITVRSRFKPMIKNNISHYNKYNRYVCLLCFHRVSFGYLPILPSFSIMT